MTRPTQRPRARAFLLAALAGTLVVGAAGTAPALGAPAKAPTDPRAELLRSFAGDAEPAAQSDREKPGARTSKAPVAGLPADASASAPQRLGAAAAATCADLDPGIVQTIDRTYVVWDLVPGATSYSVQRQRFAGAKRTIASGLSASTTSFRDAGHNPMGSAAWFVTATVSGASVTCRTPNDPDFPDGGYFSMSSPDGVGFSDAFFAGDDTVYEQDTYGPAFPAWKAALRRPAFSPTGRQLVAVEDVAGVPSITYRVAKTGKLLWSVPSPAGLAFDEPSVSPDGQTVAVEALDATDATVSRGLYTIPVWTTHTPRLVPGSAGLVTPDWVDTPGAGASSTIVAADLAPGRGLVLVNASTGARTAAAGTTGAIDPMGLPGGSVLFATNDAAGATVKVRAANGAVSTRGTFTQSDVRWPVLASDGNIYLFLRYEDESAPGTYLWNVTRLDESGAGTPAWMGQTWDGSSPGFQGFDIRTPFSAGSSDVGGLPNHDVLARSSTGVLYAYPIGDGSVPNKTFDARRQLATGWGSMKQFIAAGDLDENRVGDILAIDSAGTLWFYPGKGGFTFGTRVKVGTGWSTYSIVATGDFDGDTRADLTARDSAGRLWLYPGNGRGGVLPRKQIGSGWQIFNAILGAGDWNYDGTADIIARDRASGTLYLYPGNGSAGFGTRTVLGKGWNIFTGFAPVEVWGGINALFAKGSDGRLLDYDSVGDGVMNGNYVFLAGTGWTPYTITG